MTFVVQDPERFDKFLAERMPEHSRSRLARLIDEGKALVNGLPRKPGFGLKTGMVVVVDEVQESEPHRLAPVDIPLDVLFEDEHLLVVNKQRGLACHPAPSQRSWTLVNALLARGHGLSGVAGSFRPGIVHRLDKDTSGLLMVAKTDAAHWRLAEQIQRKVAERRYFAVIRGEPAHERYSINAPLGLDPIHRKRRAVRSDGKPAVSHFKVLHRLDDGTLVGVRLETGRTHQIRVHSASVGLPVVGDSTYGPQTNFGGPIQLHAAFLGFNHPVSDERLAFYSTPPADFVGVAFCGRDRLDPW